MDLITNFSQFATMKPTLYGQITVEGKSKIGQFRAEWHSLTNSLQYSYYSFNGYKGNGGFTLKKAYYLLINKRLSLNPNDGNPANYL